ncbi:hypothetical protein DRO33_02700 [Candidatus Bathyarchaeota archaeon]|nr:MAG: hypothetical protein DRO33_02700 [Candidatus Bathyarchaeota archaeon]
MALVIAPEVPRRRGRAGFVLTLLAGAMIFVAHTILASMVFTGQEIPMPPISGGPGTIALVILLALSMLALTGVGLVLSPLVLVGAFLIHAGHGTAGGIVSVIFGSLNLAVGLALILLWLWQAVWGLVVCVLLVAGSLLALVGGGLGVAGI